MNPAARGEPAREWIGRSWLLSGVLSTRRILDAASVCYGLVVAGFVVGAVGVVRSTGWSTPVLVGSAVLSAAVIVVMWDGSREQVVEKGLLGVLIDAVVVGWLVGPW